MLPSKSVVVEQYDVLKNEPVLLSLLYDLTLYENTYGVVVTLDWKKINSFFDLLFDNKYFII